MLITCPFVSVDIKKMRNNPENIIRPMAESIILFLFFEGYNLGEKVVSFNIFFY